MTKTLLLADDSATIQRVVELTFAREDVRVVSVGDGEQAIEAIKRSVPDVVLADIDMPGCSGFEVAQFVRSQAASAAVPVLLLAGAFESVDQAQAHEAGADGILTKPFDPAVLVSRVMALLSDGRGTPSVVHVHPPAPSKAFRLTRALEAQSAPEPVVDTTDVAAPVAELEAAALAAPAGADYFDQLDQAFAALSKIPRLPVPTDEDELPPLDDQPGPATLPSVQMPRAVPLTRRSASFPRLPPSPDPPPSRPSSTSMRWPTRSPAACWRSSPTASCARRWPTLHRPRPSGWCVKRSSGSSATSNKIIGCPVRSVP